MNKKKEKDANASFLQDGLVISLVITIHACVEGENKMKKVLFLLDKIITNNEIKEYHKLI